MLQLPQWFTVQSPRPPARSWISGKMHMKWKLWRLNNLFWVLVCSVVMFEAHACNPAYAGHSPVDQETLLRRALVLEAGSMQVRVRFDAHFKMQQL